MRLLISSSPTSFLLARMLTSVHTVPLLSSTTYIFESRSCFGFKHSLTSPGRLFVLPCRFLILIAVAMYGFTLCSVRKTMLLPRPVGRTQNQRSMRSSMANSFLKRSQRTYCRDSLGCTFKLNLLVTSSLSLCFSDLTLLFFTGLLENFATSSMSGR